MPRKRFIVPHVATFRYAVRGVGILIATQPNARFHLLATGLVIICGLTFRLSPQEWIAIALTFGLVWVAEALNTSLEFLADVVSLERHPGIRNAKDVAAGGVLLAALIAIVVGTIVFGPLFYESIFRLESQS